jgi:hypothetical protein
MELIFPGDWASNYKAAVSAVWAAIYSPSTRCADCSFANVLNLATVDNKFSSAQ